MSVAEYKSLLSNITVSYATNFKEVEKYRNFWEENCKNINYDIDYFQTVIRSRSEIKRPHLIILSENELPKTILVGRIEDIHLNMSIGYTVVLKPKVRSLSLVYPIILGDDSSEYIRILFDELENYLSKKEIDIICFSEQNVESELFKLATKKPMFFRRDNFSKISNHWMGYLGNSYDDLISSRSSNTRYNLRRYSKMLENKFPNRIKTITYKSIDSIDQFFSDTKRIADQTFQRRIGAGFDDNTEMRSLVTLSIEKGWFIANIVYIDDRPCAFWNGCVYKNTFFIWTAGYSPSYEEYHPGTYALIKILNEVYKLKNAQIIDFGFGDAQYKKNLGDHCLREATIYLFSPTVKGIYLNVVNTIINFLSLVASNVLKKFGLWDKLRKKFRKKIQRKLLNEM